MTVTRLKSILAVGVPYQLAFPTGRTPVMGLHIRDRQAYQSRRYGIPGVVGSLGECPHVFKG